MLGISDSVIGQLPYLFNCKPRLIKLFSSFRAAYNRGGLHFLFLCFIERYR